MDNNILTKVVNDIDRAAQERVAYKLRRILAGERFNLSEALADSLAGCIAAEYLWLSILVSVELSVTLGCLGPICTRMSSFQDPP